jgi:transglutaminase-like putative cysteine protease
LAGTRQLDLAHPRLRITAQKLTQAHQTLPRRATAVQDFVRGLPFAAAARGRHRTASEVLQRGQGDCVSKGILFTALCRAAGLPARLLFVKVRTPFLQGIVERRPEAMAHAVGQVFYDGRWHSTDGYVVDPVLFACAKQRLAESGLDSGWVIVRGARGAWDGRTACLQCFTAADVVETYGAFHDVDDFRRHIAEQEAGWGSSLLHELGAHLCNRRVQRLRRAGTRA